MIDDNEFDDLDDGLTYCVYCYDAVPEWKGSCCGENHFMTGFEIKDYHKPTPPKVYDAPMSQTDEYLLKQQREEENKSHGY